MHNFLCQNDKVFIKASELYQFIVWQNVSIKIGSISLFSTSDMQKFHHLLGCHAIGINPSLIFFSVLFHFLNLLCQAKSLAKKRS